MNIGLSIFGRFNLNNKVNIRDIKTSWCNIGGYKHAEFVFFESLESDFSLILGDVSVHDFDVLFDLVSQEQGVGFNFGGAENNSLSDTSITDQDVC